ncbi:MAG: sugar phosphate isomerase/epimerase [Bacteroidales bacterium]|nr:sugar phosphate isomerase/epimerase [Bacteroidales bacterium]MBN2633395.1 sugar phosphate isomerase/epimerase [Bacteroidales bacterium]
MKRTYAIAAFIVACTITAAGQKTPTGKPADFRVKTCLHSVSYLGVWRGQATLTVDEFLVKAKELGYDGVMLAAKKPHVSLIDYDDEARKKLRNRIKELGLELVCLAAYNDFTAGVDRAGIPHTEIQAVYIGELARLARDLGTNMIRIYTGYERPDLSYDRQYALVVEGLRMAGKRAAEYGVTLAIQNHHDIALHHDAMKWLLDEVNLPNVKAAFDCWSPTLEGLTSEEIRQAILTMKPYIVHTTTADYKELPRFRYEINHTNYTKLQSQMRAVPIGEGFLDYKTFINTLKEIGYQGYITYEMCEVLDGGGSIENLDKAAKKFIEYVEQFR